MIRITSLLAALALLAACADDGGVTAPAPDAQLDAQGATRAGDVYTSTNGAAGNEVVHFRRAADGSLAEAGRVATGGTGTGAGLGSQGAVLLARGGRLLVTVNAGSDDISVFARRGDGSLALVEREPSGGDMPISVTWRGDYLYVLNAGGAGNIAGFVLGARGALTPIAGAVQPLSQAGGAAPAQVAFTPNGRWLVVTEKATNRIDVYPVTDGVAGAPTWYPSAGATPFGFAFDRRGRLIVSEAHGGAPGAGTNSSYVVRDDGTLVTLAAAVPNFRTAPCWVVVTGPGKYAYISNTGSQDLSGYLVRRDGTLELLDPDGVAAPAAGGPIDAAVTVGATGYLYALTNAGTIHGYRVMPDGSLVPLDDGASGLPAGSVGLAAR